ncbi:MAG: DUF3341 domain-containing protein [Armatimonadetes bacterium]|nr:DUF3341 domain-containing protein [Armatimonadota bacterium]
MENLLYGMTAEFKDPDALLVAAKKTREAGYMEIDCYTPFPVHGLDEAIGFKEAKVQWAILLAGIAGGLGGAALEVYVSAIDQPLNIGGRPMISWPSFFPVMYECTILLAGCTALFVMLALNGLPRPNHPIFNAVNFDRATQDRFFLCIEKKDPAFNEKDTKKFMDSLGADNVSAVYADEETY